MQTLEEDINMTPERRRYKFELQKILAKRYQIQLLLEAIYSFVAKDPNITSPLIYSSNQWIGFYMTDMFVLKELRGQSHIDPFEV